MCSHHPFRGLARGLLHLILIAAIVPACDDTSVSAGNTRWIIKPGAMSLAVLVCDYLSNTFEEAALDYYPACDGCDSAGLPFSVRFNPPGDFGDISFQYTAGGDTLFAGTIIWLGAGQITYPGDFFPASEFETAAVPARDPMSVEYFNIYPKLNEETFETQADFSWNRVKDLDIVAEFAKDDYRVGIYLYAPSVGVFNPELAKWIIFLHRQKQIPVP